MFSKKGAKPPKKPAGAQRPGANLANMMGFGMQMEPDDVDESDLLAELAALEGRPVAKKKAAPPVKEKANVSIADIERMAAESMKDIDEDVDDDDEFDESELLGELDDLVREDEDEDEEDVEDVEMIPDEPQEEPVVSLKPAPQPVRKTSPAPSSGTDIKSVLAERKNMYLQAIEMAKSEGNSSKTRRFQRGLKEIEGLIKKAQRGGAINEEDIPPQVAIKGSKPPPSASDSPPPTAPPAASPPPMVQPVKAPPPAVQTPEPLIPDLPVPPVSMVSPPAVAPPSQVAHTPETAATHVDNEKLNILLRRQREFKITALKMKQAGDIDMARKCIGVSKLCDSFMDELKAGNDVDLTAIPELPTPPEATSSSSSEMTPKPQPPPPQPQPVENEQPAGSSSAPEGEGATPAGPPPAPQTIMEGFEQRLSKYQSAEKEAKDEGNGSKARRMGRIVKQYQAAIKSYKANRPVDYNELPCPPGYGPFPGVAPPPDDDDDSATPPMVAPAVPIAAPTAAPAPVPLPESDAQTAASVIKPSRNQKEYEFLVSRQKEFKFLALQAKKANDIESARDLLRKAKSLDQMITAAQNGLRVDVTQVPPLPSKKESNNESRKDDTPKAEIEFDGSLAQQYAQVENALQKQIEMSQKNLEHYKLLGNLDALKNFQELFQSSKKDLDTLMAYKKHGSPVPKCHTVLKTFPVIRSNPHLSDSELEIIVVRCVNVPLPAGWAPKDMYTYVTFELPYPQDRPQVGNTTTKKETVNPEFDESHKFIIDRKNRTFVRYCKRNGINFKVYFVRGFLKSDKALGQANIKFEHFNNRCEIHECVDLLDLEKGRKAVGGKIEVKLKIREPLVDKDAEIIKENWLVLDTHLRGLDLSTAKQLEKKPVASSSSGYESLEVLKFEKEMCEKKFNIYKSQGKQPPGALVDSIKSYQQKIHFIQTKMKEGGRPAVNEYLVALTNSLERQRMLAQEALKKNDKETAKLCLTKKKLIDKEVTVLKQRLGF